MNRTFFFLFILLCLTHQKPVIAVEKLPDALKSTGITEQIGNAVPNNLTFINQDGEKVTLRSLLSSQKPIILSMVYYHCPMLCHLILDGLNEGLSQLTASFKEKFQVVSVSFDPKETHVQAKAFQDKYSGVSSKAHHDWRFFVASQDAIKNLTQSIGFRYKYLEDVNEFAHPSAIVILNSEGKISRYLYGIQFTPFNLKIAIIEAKQKNTDLL